VTERPSWMSCCGIPNSNCLLRPLDYAWHLLYWFKIIVNSSSFYQHVDIKIKSHQGIKNSLKHQNKYKFKHKISKQNNNWKQKNVNTIIFNLVPFHGRQNVKGNSTFLKLKIFSVLVVSFWVISIGELLQIYILWKSKTQRYRYSSQMKKLN